MTSASTEKNAFELFNGWMNAGGDMLNAFSRTWARQALHTSEDTKNATDKKTSWPWTSQMEAWEKMASAMNDTLNFGTLFMNPMNMVDMAKDLQQKTFPGWPDPVDPASGWMGEETCKDASALADYNRQIIDAVMGIYHREFSKILSIPKWGLTRTYQEKLTRAIDKYHGFQKNLTEFVNILNIPLKHSYETAREHLADMSKTGYRPEELKKYHKRWLKKLETKYLELLNSPEYTRVMGNTLDAMAEFTEARQNVLQDVMKIAGVPVEKDMDELYKDLYLLKKRLKLVEKKLKASGNQPHAGANLET